MSNPTYTGPGAVSAATGPVARRESHADTPNVHLLEREHALSQLAEYAGESRVGEGRFVLVSGEAGVGKTSLLDSFAESLDDARWVRGACDDLTTPRPLGPLFDVAAHLGDDLDAACRRGAARDELFAALLDALSIGPFTVFVVEDVHWADESTRDLLRYLARRVRDLHTLVIVTYRDEAVAGTESLQALLGEVTTHASTRRIALDRLSRSGVAALAEKSALAAAELYRLTGGNPFLVAEIVQSGFTDVPPSVRDVAMARIARLSGAARAAVGVAAVIGSVVDPVVLTDVSSATPDTLDELAASGVLVSEGDTFRFRHEIIRVAVEADIPAHRRVPVHEAILCTLRSTPDADVARLAHHAVGARDREAIVRYASEAGARAAELSSHSEAAAQYELALGAVAPGDLRTEADLCDRLALELGFLDRWDEAAELRQRSLSLWRELGDRVREGDCLRRLSTAMWRLARGKDAVGYAEAAVVLLEPLGPTNGLAWAYAELARQLMSQSVREEAVASARRAEQLAEELDLPDVLSDAMNTRACVEMWLGLPWETTMREAIDIAVRRGADEQAGRAYANLAELLVYERRFGEADAIIADGVAYLERRDVQVFLRCLLGHRLELLGATAQWDDALDLADSLLRQTSPINRHSPLTVAATIKARRGETGAHELLDEALAISLSSTEAQRIAVARLGRVESFLLAERDDDAARELQLLSELDGELDEWARGAMAEWIRRTDSDVPVPAGELARPYRLALTGDHDGAAQAWEELASPYEAAMAGVYSGDDALMRDAVHRLDAMGAGAAARLARREMRRRGLAAVPAGMRSTTRANPVNLTNRELDVLRQVAAGCTNNEIADNLFISVRTAGHHVSAVLTKLGVSNRRAAAVEAARLGIDLTADAAG